MSGARTVSSAGLDSCLTAALQAVEDTYVRTIADNVGYNCAAIPIVKRTFPLHFTMGCIAHSINVMMKDIVNSSDSTEPSTRIIEFIKGHLF